MVSVVESNDARQQLSDLDRLAAATVAESRRTPWWAWVVLGAGAALFFGSYRLREAAAADWAPALWAVFVIVWVRVTRGPLRALPGRPVRTAAERRRLLVEGTAFAGVVAAGAVVGLAASWLAGGAIVGLAGAVAGVHLRRQAGRPV
jgi:hypothetical protein